MVRKSTKKELQFIIDKWNDGSFSKKTRSIKLEELKANGFNIKNKEIKGLGNFKIIKENNWISTPSFKVSILDSRKDLRGVYLDEKHPVHHRLVQNYKNGDRIINERDLIKFDINVSVSQIVIGNIQLDFKQNVQDHLSSLFKGNPVDTYLISCKDQKKTIDGKICDIQVNKKNIIQALDTFRVSKRKYNTKGYTETTFNKELLIHFKKKFNTAVKNNAQNKNYLDLVVGDVNSKDPEVASKAWVIEIKFANQMSTNKAMNIVGQIQKYRENLCQNKNYNPKSFILLMVGTDKEKDDAVIKEIHKDAKKSGVVFEYFLCT